VQSSRDSQRSGSAGVAFAFLVVMLGATLPTPLYPLYQQELGFGEDVVSVVFAAYAVGVAAALLLLGRASDVVGRRRMMLVAVAVAAVSSVVFVTSPGLGWLYVGRVLSGIGAGIVTTVGTVYLVELAPEGRGTRASLLATVVNILGLGIGPPLAGLVSNVLPAPLVTPYVVHLALCALAAVALVPTREVVVDPDGSLRPSRLQVAPGARSVFVPAAVAGFAAFSSFGLATGAAAGILGQVLGYTDRLLVGGVVFSLFGGSATAQVALQKVPTQAALRCGCVVLAAAAAILFAAVQLTSLAVLVVALVAVGVGQALIFRAAIAAINERSTDAERSGTVTTFFFVCYVGISIPVVALGFSSVQVGLGPATEAFSVGVGVLALLSLAAQLLIARRERGGDRTPTQG